MQNGGSDKRGLHNWKNLFKKPTLSDWMVTIMLLFVLIIVLFYKLDVDTCTGTIDMLLERMDECGCLLNSGLDRDGTIDKSVIHENTTIVSLDV